MAIISGTRLGPYEISAQSGVGGMGEVYQATDTNLKRQVAIKVLSDAFADRPVFCGWKPLSKAVWICGAC